MEIDKATILQAWKDEEYRDGLAPEMREQLPACPKNADGSELSDEQLEQAAGGLVLPGCVTSPLCANLTISLE